MPKEEAYAQGRGPRPEEEVRGRPPVPALRGRELRERRDRQAGLAAPRGLVLRREDAARLPRGGREVQGLPEPLPVAPALGLRPLPPRPVLGQAGRAARSRADEHAERGARLPRAHPRVPRLALRDRVPAPPRRDARPSRRARVRRRPLLREAPGLARGQGAHGRHPRLLPGLREARQGPLRLRPRGEQDGPRGRGEAALGTPRARFPVQPARQEGAAPGGSRRPLRPPRPPAAEPREPPRASSAASG